MQPTPHQTPTPSQAAALAHYGPMAITAAQQPATVKDSLTVAEVVEFAERRLAEHCQRAGMFLAKAQTMVGSAECGHCARSIDMLREQVNDVYGLATLCASIGQFEAADRISCATQSAADTLVDSAYQCRMLSIPNWAPGPLQAQQPGAAVTV